MKLPTNVAWTKTIKKTIFFSKQWPNNIFVLFFNKRNIAVLKNAKIMFLFIRGSSNFLQIMDTSKPGYKFENIYPLSFYCVRTIKNYRNCNNLLSASSLIINYIVKLPK